MTLSKDAIIQYFKALDMDAAQIIKVCPTERILSDVYFGVAKCANLADHEDDAALSHDWQRRLYGMQACYFCHVRLNGETNALRDLQ